MHKFYGGYTLLEVLVVLGLLVLIVGVTTPMLLGQYGNAKSDAARVQINAIAGSIEIFAIDTGAPPTEEQGLQALIEEPAGVSGWRGPYIRKASQLVDPWGRSYLYRTRTGSVAYEVYSLGSDNAPGGDREAADVSSQD